MTTNDSPNPYDRGIAYARDFIAAQLTGSRAHGDSCTCPACHVARSPAIKRMLEETSDAGRREAMDSVRQWRVTDHRLNCFCDLCEVARHTLRRILDTSIVAIVAFLEAVPHHTDPHVYARALEPVSQPPVS